MPDLYCIVVGGGGRGGDSPGNAGGAGGSGGDILADYLPAIVDSYTVTVGAGGDINGADGTASEIVVGVSSLWASGGFAPLDQSIPNDPAWADPHGVGGAGTYNTAAGNGGAGIADYAINTSTYYGSGGGGGTQSGTIGTGGTTGGGNGGKSPTVATNGAANTGAGGGGAWGPTDLPTTPGDGGSGIVIVSYPENTLVATGGTISHQNGKVIHTFTSNGTFTISRIYEGSAFLSFF